jgi:Zn-dependent M28 family amino/carboxypeptidase
MDVPWERATLARLQPTMSIDDDRMDETRGVRLSATLNPARAERFFEGSGHTFSGILAAADSGQPLPRFALPLTLRSRVKIEQGKAESQNVIGVLRGSDPKLRDEYVVISAHLDHVGIGEPIQGDRIYNGAMDNASGVATLLDLAQSLKQSGTKFKRTLLFVTVTGEEKGLQGSKYFANYPTVPAARIVANINFDMFLPLHPLKVLTVMGLEESDMGTALPDIAKKYSVRVQPDPQPDRNLFVRSDQYSFIRQGIPALYFKFGFDPGSPEEKIQKQWLTERYHAPSDDLKQPVDFEGAGTFNRILRDLTEALANQPERPRWKPDSFFRRFEKGS